MVPSDEEDGHDDEDKSPLGNEGVMEGLNNKGPSRIRGTAHAGHQWAPWNGIGVTLPAFTLPPDSPPRRHSTGEAGRG
jgi:hypothetical protein